MNSTIRFNNAVKLIISDFDDTVAELYAPAEPAMVNEIIALLDEGKAFFFITGQGLQGVTTRITDYIPSRLRRNVLIASCSGSEVHGFDECGDLRPEPFYSIYRERMSQDQRELWRKVINQLAEDFYLEIYPTMPEPEFRKVAGANPLAIMKGDRGPQITLEVVNGYNLPPERVSAIEKELGIAVPPSHGTYDLRVPLRERAITLLKGAELPITPRLAGVFALDFAVDGASKAEAIKRILSDEGILSTIGLTLRELANPDLLEVWGDRFTTRGSGTDRLMCEALDPRVRAIDFRPEAPEELGNGCNIILWDGEHRLHRGLLEYIRSRDH